MWTVSVAVGRGCAGVRERFSREAAVAERRSRVATLSERAPAHARPNHQRQKDLTFVARRQLELCLADGDHHGLAAAPGQRQRMLGRHRLVLAYDDTLASETACEF